MANEIATGFATVNEASPNQLWQNRSVAKQIDPWQIISHGPRPISNPECILMLKHDLSDNLTRNLQRHFSKIIVPKPVGNFTTVVVTTFLKPNCAKTRAKFCHDITHNILIEERKTN
ncbi:hypothetical protein COLO4_16144 [Corchorus olitorius]|uniref:Uncharacterized protein n=1 Tax=Corchorus olitorius TaxID=93759 RepID=A0A1R3JJA6_9ROSI|nr:hypothetical protein COLO4_16144 [Corchorus olitorius]